ncbi:MAG: hypothetical protein ABJG15_09140 [Hyphomonadaceae bacterium]
MNNIEDGLYLYESEKAMLLAHYSLILNDLDDVVRMLDEHDKEEISATNKEALWLSVLTKYRRCFGSCEHKCIANLIAGLDKHSKHQHESLVTMASAHVVGLAYSLKRGGTLLDVKHQEVQLVHTFIARQSESNAIDARLIKKYVQSLAKDVIRPKAQAISKLVLAEARAEKIERLTANGLASDNGIIRASKQATH